MHGVNSAWWPSVSCSKWWSHKREIDSHKALLCLCLRYPNLDIYALSLIQNILYLLYTKLYIYICVCVCVCVYAAVAAKDKTKNKTKQNNEKNKKKTKKKQQQIYCMTHGFEG